MDENVTASGAEVTTQIVENAVKPEPSSEVAELKKMLEETNKKWQSKFDTVLGEKKTVESSKMTVEQRLEQIEQERQNERMDWSRKEAKAKAQIDDELDAAIKLYAGSDFEKVADGASGIRSIIDRIVLEKTEAAVKSALEKIGSQPSPKGGAGNTVEITRESLKTPEGRKAMMEKAKQSGGSIPITE